MATKHNVYVFRFEGPGDPQQRDTCVSSLTHTSVQFRIVTEPIVTDTPILVKGWTGLY